SLMLSQKISEGLRAKQFSKVAFANLMGVQPSIITRWLSGKHNFTVETLFEIEECLGIKLVAIDPPGQNSVNFHFKANTNYVSFNESKMFPGFTSINLKEVDNMKIAGSNEDLEAYLSQLRIQLEKHGK